MRSAKNDFEGVGNKICFKVWAITPTVPFCLASEMFVLNAEARPLSEHPFLSYRGQWSYDVTHLNTAIKRTVVRIGLDPKRFDSVSLRIAGACTRKRQRPRLSDQESGALEVGCLPPVHSNECQHARADRFHDLLAVVVVLCRGPSCRPRHHQ